VALMLDAGAARAKRGRPVMKRILCASLSILLMPSAYAASLPGDSAEGQRLFAAHCTECHQTDVFTRKDRKIQSLDALKEQLVACSHAAKVEFSASEMQDLLKYLNDQFYHFD
jgi:mono/diheme cytochrome c family protein